MKADRRPAFVGVGLSHADDACTAMAEAARALDLREACFVLALVPERLGRRAVLDAVARHLPGLPVFGAVTPGQITPDGYDDTALLLIAFPRRHFRCASMVVAPLQPLSIGEITATVRHHADRFPRTAGWNRLALGFADGTAKQEDLLISTLVGALEDVPVFGGSVGASGTGDAGGFVLHGGTFRENAALLLLIDTDLEFHGVAFDHFLPTDRRMVVTHALPEDRLVIELNGAPAAREYARLVGCAPEALSPRVFAENPALMRQNRSYHVRAIHLANPDGSLSFLCSVDDGLLLTLGRGKEIVSAVEAGLDLQGGRGARPDFVLGFDCILRRLEIEQKGLSDQVSEVFRRRRVLGLNTFGEQYRGLHLNQTFAGVAFFDPVEARLH